MTSAGPEDAITSFLNDLRSLGGFHFDAAVSLPPERGEGQATVPIEVVLSGPDTALLLARDGELLHAFESMAAAVLRLPPEGIRFDAGDFQATHAAEIERLVADAVARVETTGQPQSLPPMNSRDRRLVHLSLVSSGLATASSGVGPQRFVVLYPAGQQPDPLRFAPAATRPRLGGATRGYGQREGKSSFSRRPERPWHASSPVAKAPSGSSGLQQEQTDAEGNREKTVPDTLDPATTEARLESIRRAFRKR